MSSKAERRAEARRRSRQRAAGIEVESSGEADGAVAPAPRPSFLGSLFPPAPPLRGKGDPMAGFTYHGPLAATVSGLWLLARGPFIWGAPALGWALAQVMLLLTGRHPIAFALSVIQFGLLIAAGWIGWQRPWLFGLAAGLGGLVAYVGLVAVIGWSPGVPEGWAALAVSVVAGLGLFQPVIGAVAGFYGGYLRRRMQAPVPTKTANRRPR